jgi:hypothetical protein
MQKSSLGFKADAFQCPNCRVYAKQEWHNVAKGHLSEKGVGYYEGFLENLFLSVCSRCRKYSLWLDEKMIYPVSSVAPWPIEDMPPNVKDDFLEGRNVVNASPRAAAALLRQALQKLMVHLGESGKRLDEDLADLTRKGLPKKIRSALDAVRVVGNDAVHLGEINSKDDTDTAIALFNLLNMIVEVMISQPKKVNDLYTKLPNSTTRPVRKSNRKGMRTQRRRKKWEPIPKPTILYR